MPNSSLGWAEITHPFHPLRGQRFLVLKSRRVAGVDTLILADVARGSFGIAREWTDWGAPSGQAAYGDTARRFDFGTLLDLVVLIDRLTDSPSKNIFAKELDI